MENIKKKLYKVKVYEVDYSNANAFSEYFVIGNNHKEVIKKVDKELQDFPDIKVTIETIELIMDDVIL